LQAALTRSPQQPLDFVDQLPPLRPQGHQLNFMHVRSKPESLKEAFLGLDLLNFRVDLAHTLTCARKVQPTIVIDHPATPDITD
jgi:hypothetical protein